MALNIHNRNNVKITLLIGLFIVIVSVIADYCGK
jgi:hypothetical protein